MKNNLSIAATTTLMLALGLLTVGQTAGAQGYRERVVVGGVPQRSLDRCEADREVNEFQLYLECHSREVMLGVAYDCFSRSHPDYRWVRLHPNELINRECLLREKLHRNSDRFDYRDDDDRRNRSGQYRINADRNDFNRGSRQRRDNRDAGYSIRENHDRDHDHR